ncbi:MAG: hypothetical protein A3J46_00060 [Candidatus Yanofskybacteria bacterium RIFCSPHIGHO2_02_FULL_41_11]|uniref:Phosphoribosyltransferase domain-containing protein n=1 Tax=Candidatus Yanofskybacteria bacterium RIFCSPHIGHO2_02_FULL_41_11 TaxID=1802675 RepID=A0A1F8FAV3_9BACT|nr:MAG: hypothetical protein A3J46_00060 [Candidatus Yanofskybacteria bacterium RIFCSPHIGHO2_02_FULL_41_11]
MPNYPQNQRFDRPFFKKALKKSDHGSGLVPHHSASWRIWCGAQKATSWILDVMFPKTCLGCGKFISKSDFDYICRKCFSEIEIKNSFECIGCKKETKFGLTCVFCRKENGIDQLLIAAKLTDPVDRIIKAFKYRFIPDMRKPLLVIAQKSIKKLLSKRFNLFEDNPLIAPIPLHKVRLNERGFNQSWLIAKGIAGAFYLSSDENLLSKKYNFKHQANTKSREERLNNVKNNFVLSDPARIKERTVILVDDICTTGATLNECAKVLKNPPVGEGAKKVIGFVIARGQFKS